MVAGWEGGGALRKARAPSKADEEASLGWKDVSHKGPEVELRLLVTSSK